MCTEVERAISSDKIYQRQKVRKKDIGRGSEGKEKPLGEKRKKTEALIAVQKEGI